MHRTCDPEADTFTYQKKNEMLPDYQYVCSMCKKFGRSSKRKDSAYFNPNFHGVLGVKVEYFHHKNDFRISGFDDSNMDISMSASQESLTSDDMDIDMTDKVGFLLSTLLSLIYRLNFLK